VQFCVCMPACTFFCQEIVHLLEGSCLCLRVYADNLACILVKKQCICQRGSACPFRNQDLLRLPMRVSVLLQLRTQDAGRPCVYLFYCCS
jgi:hypothetical protein